MLPTKEVCISNRGSQSTNKYLVVTAGCQKCRPDGRRTLVYDANQMLMDFQRANSQDMQIGHLRQRYLWGPPVDQILDF